MTTPCPHPRKHGESCWSRCNHPEVIPGACVDHVTVEDLARLVVSEVRRERALARRVAVAILEKTP